MSDNLIDFLSKVKVETSNNLYSFLYFDKQTGKIEKITNKQSNDQKYECLKVKLSLVEDLINGKQRIEDYRVVYNSKIKDFEIIKIEENFCARDINNILLKINKTVKFDADSYDVVIQQNNKTKSWNIDVNSNINFIKNVNNILFFSVTEKNDPNILYRTIMFDALKLVDNSIQIPYIYENESDLNNISVYTNKVLDSYIHKAIND
jgi:hypothetical protein